MLATASVSQAARAVVARSVSLGRNCEFGLVQRRYGHEPIGLLRWADSPLEAVIRGFATRFAHIGESLTLRPSSQGDEWLALDDATGITFHSEISADRPEEDVRRQEERRLPRLAEKLLEDVADRRKLLVYSSALWRSPREGLGLLHAVRSVGDAALLLVAQGAGPLRDFGGRCWGGWLPQLTEVDGALHLGGEAWDALLVDVAAGFVG